MIPKLVDRGVALVAAGMVASVALALAGLTWGRDRVDDGRARAALVAAPPPATLDLSPITRFAPFGSAASVAGAAGDSGALGLQLRGILLARPASASGALIAAAGGPAKAYAVGETLPGGAVLDAVEFDLVVLRIDGQLQTLAFATKPGASTASAQPAPAVAPIGPQPRTGDPAPREASAAADPDPQSLLASLGATATPAGYRVASPSDDMRRAGLQPGDIVEKVNGQALGDPTRDRALFDDAVVSGRVRVDAVRDGKRVATSFQWH